MAQEVATQSDRAVSTASEPVLSPEITWRVERYARSEPLLLEALSSRVLAEAAAALPIVDAQCGPVSRKRITDWMELVARSVANPPDKLARDSRIEMVAETSGDLPIGVWTRETRAAFSRARGAAGSGGFWPSDAEIDGFLRPLARKLKQTSSLLVILRDEAVRRSSAEGTGSGQEASNEPSEEEREEVRRLAAQCKAAITEGARERELRSARPSIDLKMPPRDVSLKGERLEAMRAERMRLLGRNGS